MATVYCVGRNYAAHARELGNEVPDNPVIFLKAWNSIRGCMPQEMAYPGESFEHEVEVVLHMGKRLGLSQKATRQHLAAIGLGLDLTRREVQNTLKAKGLPWTLAKSFQGAAIITPPLAQEHFADLADIRFFLDVEGKRKQEGCTALMIFPVLDLLTYIASFHTLDAGDLVFTGTPSGVGPITQGQRFCMGFEQPQQIWSGEI